MHIVLMMDSFFFSFGCLPHCFWKQTKSPSCISKRRRMNGKRNGCIAQVQYYVVVVSFPIFEKEPKRVWNAYRRLVEIIMKSLRRSIVSSSVERKRRCSADLRVFFSPFFTFYCWVVKVKEPETNKNAETGLVKCRLSPFATSCRVS